MSRLGNLLNLLECSWLDEIQKHKNEKPKHWEFQVQKVKLKFSDDGCKINRINRTELSSSDISFICIILWQVCKYITFIPQSTISNSIITRSSTQKCCAIENDAVDKTLQVSEDFSQLHYFDCQTHPCSSLRACALDSSSSSAKSSQ